MRMIILLFSLFLLHACVVKSPKHESSIGKIEVIDPELLSILDTNASIEIIAEGHEWTEGPVWVASEKKLLYSDIPQNRIFEWTEERGAVLYLKKSGYTGSKARGGELGSNGLLLDNNGKLILCQHGDRRIAMMDAAVSGPESRFISLADNYNGKRFNSPNDACLRSNGDIFLTDPPYGLEGYVEDPAKEIPFQGVYKASNGKTQLLTDSITRPNGIALLNSEKTLLVANSDPEKAKWYLFELGNGDSLYNPRLLFDATSYVTPTSKGLPDGLKVDGRGNIFATGPGGVFIFNAAGKLLGRLLIPEACSNLALADDGKTLFITADMYVLKMKMRP